MTGPMETWVGSLYGTVLTSRMGVRSSEALALWRCLALRGGGSWGCHQPSDGSIWRRVYPRGTRPGLSTRWAGSPGEGLTATSASPSSDPPQLGHGQHVGRECLEPWEQHERGEASLTQNHRAPSAVSAPDLFPGEPAPWGPALWYPTPWGPTPWGPWWSSWLPPALCGPSCTRTRGLQQCWASTAGEAPGQSLWAGWVMTGRPMLVTAPPWQHECVSTSMSSLHIPLPVHCACLCPLGDLGHARDAGECVCTSPPSLYPLLFVLSEA